MPERHKVGDQWIEVPECITAQGPAAVGIFVTMSAEDRAKEIGAAQAAAQARIQAVKDSGTEDPVGALVTVIGAQAPEADPPAPSSPPPTPPEN